MNTSCLSRFLKHQSFDSAFAKYAKAVSQRGTTLVYPCCNWSERVGTSWHLRDKNGELLATVPADISFGTRLKDVSTRGRFLLNKHGLTDWTVVIDSYPTYRIGQCRFDQKEIGLSQFAIPDDMPNEDMDVLLLHEIAHVLTPGFFHWVPWKEKYAELLRNHFEDAATVRRFLSRHDYIFESEYYVHGPS